MQKGLARDPGLSGSVAVKLVVKPDGHVRTADVKPIGGLPAEVAKCIRTALLATELEPTGRKDDLVIQF
jgi:hypothetical protein